MARQPLTSEHEPNFGRQIIDENFIELYNRTNGLQSGLMGSVLVKYGDGEGQYAWDQVTYEMITGAPLPPEGIVLLEDQAPSTTVDPPDAGNFLLFYRDGVLTRMAPDGTETVVGSGGGGGGTHALEEHTDVSETTQAENDALVWSTLYDPYTLSENFEDSTLAFTISGTWFRSTDQAHAGTYSFKSADISDSQESDATFSVTVPAGAINAELSFWYRVDSEDGPDYLEILVDDSSEFWRSGFWDWDSSSIALVEGTHTIVLRYHKDSTGTVGGDAAWIDDLTLSYDAANPKWAAKQVAERKTPVRELSADPATPVEGEEWLRSSIAMGGVGGPAAPEMRFNVGTSKYKARLTKFEEDGSPVTPTQPIPHTILGIHGGSTITWSGLPGAVTEFLGTAINRVQADLTNVTQARIVCYATTIAQVGAELRVQYLGTSPSTWLYFDGSSGPKVVLSATGLLVGAWVDWFYVLGALRDTVVRIVGTNGNGTGTNAWSSIYVQVR